MKTKLVIVGGVAGGMSCAARARRLSEDSEIIVFERGPYPSFANCGLPYYIGGEISERGKLLVQTAEKLRKINGLDVRVLQEVVAIDRTAKEVRIRKLETGEEYNESYDKLVLSPGASPIRPPLSGINLDGIFTLRTVPDTDAILNWIEEHQCRRAVIGGGGYIGLEVAEQLHHKGLEVSIVEMGSQIMAPLDPEMAELLHDEIRQQGVRLILKNGLKSFEKTDDGIQVTLQNEESVTGDLVVLGLGVRPESQLAKECGLEVGPRGGLSVSETLQTSDSNIYAIGDAIEVSHRITNDKAPIPLAGPANRQGRMVADQIYLGTESKYAGTQGTAILRLFSLTAACTGANETLLKSKGMNYEAVHLHPANHAGYYPGASGITMKLLFNPKDGRVLGAQAVGRDGVDKRIDVLATAIAGQMTVDDLAQLELCYAPPFGSAKDPVNLAGMIAQNIMNGLVKQVQWHEIQQAQKDGAVVVDVREEKEREAGMIKGSIHIPLGEIRNRLNEIPKEKPVIVHCASGLRSYNACRILMQKGFEDVRNLSGSWKTWSSAHPLIEMEK